ncbi:MAG: sulfatase-like hydrolase/transferase [Rhodoglobus sp.]
MSQSTQTRTPPNVVLIFMDDMTHWALRSSQIETPSLDRLRAMGITFTHAFNQGSMDAAVCMPARQMLMSGLTLFDAAKSYLDVPRLGAVLGENGYNTYFTGKWHNEVEALERDYQEVGPWGPNMLDSTPMYGDAYLRPTPGNDWDPADKSRGGHWMTREDGTIEHSSERWTDAAVDFLNKAHDEDKPFFLHIAYHAPHDPRQADQEFLDLYPLSEVRVPPNAMPVHPFDNGELDIRDEVLAPTPRTPEAVQLHRKEYFAILTHADREIGRILDALDLSGDLENTVIVFSGDHGLALGEHGLMGKQNLYDHSVRVPLVIAGPGVPVNTESSELVYSGSIFATICHLSGIPQPEHLGFPVLPYTADMPASHDAIFGAYKDLQRSIRTAEYKLIEYPQIQQTQLFSISDDPWELTNLAEVSDHAALMTALQAMLATAQAQFRDHLATTDRARSEA